MIGDIYKVLLFLIHRKWIEGLSFGLIRWVQMYSAFIEGKILVDGRKSNIFSSFSKFFRKNDKYENYEAQTNQAAGVFLNGFGKIPKQKFMQNSIIMIQNKI